MIIDGSSSHFKCVTKGIEGAFLSVDRRVLSGYIFSVRSER